MCDPDDVLYVKQFSWSKSILILNEWPGDYPTAISDSALARQIDALPLFGSIDVWDGNINITYGPTNSVYLAGQLALLNPQDHNRAIYIARRFFMPPSEHTSLQNCITTPFAWPPELFAAIEDRFVTSVRVRYILIAKSHSRFLTWKHTGVCR